jgi:hypothetical protein
MGPVIEYELPKTRQIALDLRWATPKSVYLADPFHGIFEITLETPVTQTLFLEGGRTSLVFMPSRLAVSPETFVVAAPVLQLAWGQRANAPTPNLLSIAFVLDVDVHQDRVLILGARKNESGRLAPDGVIAWVGLVSDGLSTLKPVLVSKDGIGARSMDHCGILGSGAVRFQNDGSFVVAPGVERGIYLYGAAGKLRKAWDTASLGLHNTCEMERQQAWNLSADPEARKTWINQRRVVDDVLALPDGPALIVRERVETVTRWSLVRLYLDKAASSQDLPMISESDAHRLKGAVLGRKIAFLMTDEFSNPDLADPPRLLVGALSPGNRE